MTSACSSIADLGKGVYYYVEHAHQVPAAFADCLGGLMSVCAQNIVLTCRVWGLRGEDVFLAMEGNWIAM